MNNFANSTYERRDDIAAGHPGWSENYSEVWGLFPAIKSVFALLASLPALEAPSYAIERGREGRAFAPDVV